MHLFVIFGCIWIALESLFLLSAGRGKLFCDRSGGRLCRRTTYALVRDTINLILLARYQAVKSSWNPVGFGWI